MSELSRLSGVPAPTIKHYIREKLLPPPALRTSPNMAYYDVGLIPRIKAIKELQRTQYLPLNVIREILAQERPEPDDATAATAIVRVLRDMAPTTSMRRSEILAAGNPDYEVDWFKENELIEPADTVDGEDVYAGNDLAFLEFIRHAREQGISEEILPHTSMGPYYKAVQELVRVELQLFRDLITPLSDGEMNDLTETAVWLSERLVVLLRRRALLPVLTLLIREDAKTNK
ncbi:MAG: hypothetical protein CMH54_01745 [Myxococcales bacterium]|nr:hypothetical protein [Myxococcales bacterium]